MGRVPRAATFEIQDPVDLDADWLEKNEIRNGTNMKVNSMIRGTMLENTTTN
jgi:hypothetical protein